MREYLKYAQPDYLDFVSELEDQDFTISEINALAAGARSLRNQVLGSTSSWSFCRDRDLAFNLGNATWIETMKIIAVIDGLTGYTQPVTDAALNPKWEGPGKFARLQVINDLLWALQRYEYESILARTA